MLPFQRTFISSYPKATQDTPLLLTHATSKLGNWLNLKMFLYLIHLFLTERFRIFNPSLRVARERWQTVSSDGNPKNRNYSFTKFLEKIKKWSEYAEK